MPAALGWLVLLLGLAAVAACFLLPREIGKQDEPVLNIRVELPPVGEMIENARFAAWNRRKREPGRLKPVRPPRAFSADPVSAMGAPQPAIQQPAAAPYVLPANGDNGNN